MKLDVVYDVGAHTGAFSTEMKRYLSNSDFILFEANESMEAALAKTGFRYVIAALSSRNGTVEFFQKGGTGDSYYREATDVYVKIPPRIINCKTLDSVIESEQIPLPDMIKLDTQGSELDILSGGTNARTSASLIYLEAPIFAYNEGAPDIRDYLHMMEKWGYIASGIHEINSRYDVLIQIDILFIRRDILEVISPRAKTFYCLS